jgi:hypothetical protein
MSSYDRDAGVRSHRRDDYAARCPAMIEMPAYDVTGRRLHISRGQHTMSTAGDYTHRDAGSATTHIKWPARRLYVSRGWHTISLARRLHTSRRPAYGVHRLDDYACMMSGYAREACIRSHRPTNYAVRCPAMIEMPAYGVTGATTIL